MSNITSKEKYVQNTGFCENTSVACKDLGQWPKLWLQKDRKIWAYVSHWSQKTKGIPSKKYLCTNM